MVCCVIEEQIVMSSKLLMDGSGRCVEGRTSIDICFRVMRRRVICCVTEEQIVMSSKSKPNEQVRE